MTTTISTDTGFTDEELQLSQDTPINQINNYLFLGSVEACDPAILEEHGITTIIRLCSRAEEGEIMFRCPDNITHHLHFIADHHSRLITPLIYKSHYIIQQEQEHGGKVLVHCQAGISRSATIVIGHLILTGMSATNALKYVERKRPCVWPNAGFQRELLELEEEH